MKRILWAVLFLGGASSLWAGTAAGFLVQAEGGLTSPVGGILYRDLATGYNAGGALGWRLDPRFSILLSGEWHTMDSQTAEGAPVYSLNVLEIAAVERFVFGALTPMHPYLFLGEGAAVNEPAAGTPFASAGNETDPLVEGGTGLLFVLGDRLDGFLQVKASLDFASTKIAPDRPVFYLPFQAGLDFNP
jgi:hypothetical protein